MSFIQNGPKVNYENFDSDGLITRTLAWLVDQDQTEVRQFITKDLKHFYQKVLPQTAKWSADAESNPPQHIPYSPWGERVDDIKTHEGWNKLDAISASEGLIHLGYHGQHKYGRIHQFLKLFLFHPDSAFYTCPLAIDLSLKPRTLF